MKKFIVYWNEYYDVTPVKLTTEQFFNEEYTEDAINKINNLKVNELVEIEEGHLVIRVR